MVKVKFKKAGLFAGSPNEPQIKIEKAGIGKVQEVSESLAKISVESGVAEYVKEADEEVKPKPRKTRANPAKADKQLAETK